MTVETTATAGALPVPIESHARGLGALSDWLAAADSASQLARQLVHSFFVPQAYKPSGPNGVEVAVANATGAILLGQSLGLDPLTSLQQIYVVHGRPGMYSRMKVALAQRDGHRIWEEEYGPERSTWAGQRKGSEDVVRITITIEDAKRAGWTSNAAYSKTPADMLAARCSARVVDRIAADALFGIRSIEDLDDEPAPTVTARVDAAAILSLPAPVATPAPVAKAPSSPVENQDTAKPRRTRKAAAPAEAPAPVEATAQAEPPATPEQLADLVRLAEQLGMTTTTQRRAYIGDRLEGFDPHVGLTTSGAAAVISALHADLWPSGPGPDRLEADEAARQSEADERAEAEQAENPEGWA